MARRTIITELDYRMEQDGYGNLAAIARLMGISADTLYTKMRRQRLNEKDVEKLHDITGYPKNTIKSAIKEIRH